VDDKLLADGPIAAGPPGPLLDALAKPAEQEQNKALPALAAKPAPSTPTVRSNFPETWLWVDTNVKLRLKHTKFECPFNCANVEHV
jgi:hypothetical protein